MCVVSFVGDHYRDKWEPQPWFPYQPHVPLPLVPGVPTPPKPATITREEFEQLRRDVLEMKELLKKAKAYDEATGQPDCELDAKLEVLRRVAKMVGVDLEDVLKPAGKPA